MKVKQIDVSASIPHHEDEVINLTFGSDSVDIEVNGKSVTLNAAELMQIQEALGRYKLACVVMEDEGNE